MFGSRNTAFGVLILLAIAGCAWADLDLAGDKLVLDAAVWTNGHAWRAEEGGLTHNEFAVERVVAPVGLTGRLGQVASMRLSADVGTGSAWDLYADLRWPSGFYLRAGQFLLPLGFEALTDPREQPLVNSSLLAGYAAPAGARDIGATSGFENHLLSIAGAVVNGAGANNRDYDQRKDVCGRVVLRPLSTVDGAFALRAYYRGPDASDTAWLTAAVEAFLVRGPLEVQAEFQNRYSSDVRNNAAYLQAVWSIGQLQPVARLDLVMPQGSRSDWMITGGLNLQSVPEHLKVMLDCTYRRNYKANWSVFGFLFRLQAAI